MKTARATTRTCLLLTLAIVGLAQAVGHSQEPNRRRSGPRDWSHGRVIATRFGPDSDQNLAKNWRTVRKHAQIERARESRSQADGLFATLRERLQKSKRPAPVSDDAPELDWNLRTGGYGSVVGSPAKYNFDISASNCTDVIYFTVDQAGAASTVNVIAITNPYAGCPGNPTGTTPTVKFGSPDGHGHRDVGRAEPRRQDALRHRIAPRRGGLILHAINVNNII